MLTPGYVLNAKTALQLKNLAWCAKWPPDIERRSNQPRLKTTRSHGVEQDIAMINFVTDHFLNRYLLDDLHDLSTSSP